MAFPRQRARTALLASLVLGLGGAVPCFGEEPSEHIDNLRVASGQEESLSKIMLSPDGKFFVTAEASTLRIWERKTGRVLTEVSLPGTITLLQCFPEAPVLYVSTTSSSHWFSLETLGQLKAGRIAGLRSIVFDEELGVWYGLTADHKLTTINPEKQLGRFAKDDAEWYESADGSPHFLQRKGHFRLIPHNFERVLVWGDNALGAINTIDVVLEPHQRKFRDPVKFADLDADRLVALETARDRNLANLGYRLSVLAKDDFRTLGECLVPVSGSALPSIHLPPRAAYTQESGKLYFHTANQLYEIQLEGDTPRLERTVPTPKEGGAQLSLRTLERLPDDDAMHFFAGGSTRGGRIGTLHLSPAGEPRFRAFGRTPLQPWKLQTHPRADEFYVQNDSGRMKRIRILPDRLEVSSIGGYQNWGRIFSANGSELYYPGNGWSLRRQVIDRLRATDELPPATDVPHGGRMVDVSADVALSPDGRFYATNSSGHLKIHEMDTGRLVHEGKYGHYGMGLADGFLDFSPDGRFLAFCALPKKEDYDQAQPVLACLEVATGELVWRYESLGAVSAVHYLDASTVACVSQRNGLLQTFDARTGTQLKSHFMSWHPDLPRGSTRGPFRVAYSSDNARIAMANATHLTVLDALTFEPVAHLPRSSHPLLSFAFFSNPNFLLLGDAGNRIQLWDVGQNRPLARIALFANDDEWILSAPDFRFASSPGAAERMYLVRGTETLSLESLFEQYYTPGLMGRLLAGEALAPLVPANALSAPPEVEVALLDADGQPLKQAPESGGVRVRVEARSEGAELAEIRLYHNGKVVSGTQRGLVVEDDEPAPEATHVLTRTYTLSLLDGVNEFRAIALNAQRTESEPVTVSLDAGGVIERAGGLQLHLVVVGIDAYENPKYALNYAVADATAFARELESGAEGVFGEVHTTLLLNQEASREAILGALQETARLTQPRDVLVFYYAGHGVMTEGSASDFFLVPPGVRQLYGNDEGLAQDALPATELRDLATRIPALKQLFILDACQSAGALNQVAKRGVAEERAIAQLARSTGTYWLTATGSEQFAVEFTELGHGVFTYSVLEALRGASDDGDGQLTVRELDAFLQRRVPELTRIHRGSPQYPASYGFGQDFPISLFPSSSP